MQYMADFLSQLTDLIPARNWNYDLRFLRTLIAMILALTVAFWIIRIANRFLPKIAERITDQAEIRSQGDKMLAVKRTETILNVVAAAGRAIIILLCLYIGWRIMNPGSAPLAIIGAGTVFVIIGVATVSPLLRDIMSGVVMITEHWYEVGDFVAIDPFMETKGVVEQINLRSTKIRSQTGEIIWIHNQYVQGVRVTPRGLRTISVDVFVNDLDKGMALVEKTLSTLPNGPSMIATPLRITDKEQLGDIWRITATGQTTPGREWLVEDFAVKALVKMDSDQKQQVMMYEPVSRYTDEAAEKRFLRSISIKGTRGAVRNKKSKQDFVTHVEEI